jgi:hypothetical protein
LYYTAVLKAKLLWWVNSNDLLLPLMTIAYMWTFFDDQVGDFSLKRGRFFNMQ